jgi:hypothetical protein
MDQGFRIDSFYILYISTFGTFNNPKRYCGINAFPKIVKTKEVSNTLH